MNSNRLEFYLARLAALVMLAYGLLPASAVAAAMAININARDLDTGAVTEVQDIKRAGTASGDIPLGSGSDLFGAPAAARAISTEDGIVRGSIRTPVEPYRVDNFMQWDARFTKDSSDASFDFTISQASLETGDYGSGFSGELRSLLDFTVMLDGITVFQHRAEIIELQLVTNSGPMQGTFAQELFLGQAVEAKIDFTPYRQFVDLSGIEVGEDFLISYFLQLEAVARGGETWADARLSDPANFNGGVATNFTGLTAVPLPAAGWLLLSGLAALIRIRNPASRLQTPRLQDRRGREKV